MQVIFRPASCRTRGLNHICQLCRRWRAAGQYPLKNRFAPRSLPGPRNQRGRHQNQLQGRQTKSTKTHNCQLPNTGFGNKPLCGNRLSKIGLGLRRPPWSWLAEGDDFFDLRFSLVRLLSGRLRFAESPDYKKLNQIKTPGR
jgi:hypothetical protein